MRRQRELDDGLSALYQIINHLRDRVHKLEGRLVPSHLDPYTFKLVDRKPVQCPNDEAWFRWHMNMDNRRVGWNEIGDVVVSTVFVSMDLRPPPDQGKLFETVIMGGERDRQYILSATWEEAERTHAAVVAEVTNAGNPASDSPRSDPGESAPDQSIA